VKCKTFRQSEHPRRFLFCTRQEWFEALIGGLVVSLLLFPWYRHISYLIGFTLLLVYLTVANMLCAYRFIVPFPHAAILIASLQYVLAAWLSACFPPTDPSYDLGAQLPEYLCFGCLTLAAFAFGWATAVRKVGCRHSISPMSSKRLLWELDLLFWLGIVFGIISRLLQLESLMFVLLLCANLRYVGALGRMLVRGQGWQWRFALTLLIELIIASRQGMYHTLLLWSLSGFIVYLFSFRPRPRFVLCWFTLGMLLLPAMQEAKWKLREKRWQKEIGQGLTLQDDDMLGLVRGAWDSLFALSKALYNTATLRLEREFIADTAVRYNQGWIISRVMQHVPSEEPYAHGETLLTAAQAALVPRMLAPQKFRAGGSAYYERFTGLRLTETTSMNLGYAGEMYANFGYWGAIIGCFGYAFLLGLGFRWIANRAWRSPLWWVVIPYVGNIAFKAEEGTLEVLNWIVKASLVTAAVYFFFPAIRVELAHKVEGRRSSETVTEISPMSLRPDRPARNKARRNYSAKGLHRSSSPEL